MIFTGEVGFEPTIPEKYIDIASQRFRPLSHSPTNILLNNK